MSLKDTLTGARYVVLCGLTDYLLRHVDGDDDELLLVVIEKKVERCKVVELFKARRESIGLKNLFSMRLLLSEAKL